MNININTNTTTKTYNTDTYNINTYNTIGENKDKNTNNEENDSNNNQPQYFIPSTQLSHTKTILELLTTNEKLFINSLTLL
jgi:hypothetical protein